MENLGTSFQPLLPSKRTAKAASAKAPTKRKAKPKKTARAQPIATLAANKPVTYTSQAAGKFGTKVGKIVAHVKAGENIFEILATKMGFKIPSGAKNMEIRFGRAISKDDRYIVRVSKSGEDRDGRNRITSYYGPTVKTVEKQMAANKPIGPVKVPPAPPITITL